MNRVRVGWSGWNGAPGVTTFYLGDTTTSMTALTTFFTAIKGNHPSAITFTIPNLGDQINDTDGLIVGSWSGTGGGTVVATGGSAGYAGGSGYCVDWQSGGIIDGRRRQGRSFFVPAISATFQGDGTLVDAVKASIQASANALIASYAGEMKIWSRPFPGKAATPTKPAKPPRVGAAVTVINANVPDLAAVLRSRRT